MARGVHQIVNFVAAIVALVFAIIVLGAISSQVLKKPGASSDLPTVCYYEFNPNSKSRANTSTSICDFGIAMGAIGLLAGIAYVILNGSDLFREVDLFVGRVALVLRGAGAGFLALLWLICFAVLTDAYNNKSGKDATNTGSSTKSAMQAGIAFSFLSIILWGIICGFSIALSRTSGPAGTFQPGTKPVTTTTTTTTSIQPKPLQEES